MLGNVCHSMLGISKSTFSTTRLELENIILPNIIILCFHSIFRDFKQKLSLNFSNHVGIRSHHIANIYIPCVFHSIFRDFKQKLSLNFTDHGGIRNRHIANIYISSVFSQQF